jgi:sugar/nucleoside kinase (ribokinase family)
MSAKSEYIIIAGEYLVDMMSEGFASDLLQVDRFQRFAGGSAANLAMNLVRLGHPARLVTCLGKDAIGDFLWDQLEQLGADTKGVSRHIQPTTLILVTRSKEVSSFEAYRGADCQISDEQFPESDLSNTRLFHTTCFALSKEPARTAIMKAAETVAQSGGQLSIDLNYADKIWDYALEEGQEIVARYCSWGPLVKVSEVDFQRLYPGRALVVEEVLDHFLGLGASEVCLTLGAEGVWVANQKMKPFLLPANKIEVKDTTGAGDAFWSGYLSGWLMGEDTKGRLTRGRAVAELKLQHLGPLPEKVQV